MPDAPTFQQVAAAPGLYALTPAAAVGWAGYWAGANAGFGSSVTLDEAWNDPGGAYVMCAIPPTDLPAFAAGLAVLIPISRNPTKLRLLWIANPTIASAGWRTQALFAQFSGGDWVLALQNLLTLGRYALSIPVFAPMTQPTSGYGIAIGGAGVTFLSPTASFPAAAGSVVIPLADPGIGTVTATLPIGPGGGDAFAQLGVALRYVFPSEAGPVGTIEMLDMPVLGQNAQTFSLFLGMFPGVPMDPALTSLSFFAPAGAGSGPILSGNFRTTLGYGTTLTPMAAGSGLAAARLVFGASPLWQPVAKGSPPAQAYHLCPDGAFALTTLTPPPPQTPAGALVDRVLLGASGTEYAGLLAQSGNIVLFAGGAPAYAPTLDTGSNPSDQTSDNDVRLLTLDATTAAATLLPPTGTLNPLGYFAQPRQAPFYQAGAAHYLDFLELPTATLSTTAASLPLGLYTGLAPAHGAMARKLEAAVLAPMRRRTINATGGPPPPQPPPVPASTIVGTSPQGLVVQVSADRTQWQSVVVANMEKMTPPQRAFTRVGTDFQAALQADQLFFVVADPTKISSCPTTPPAPPRCSSVSYRLNSLSLDVLLGQGVTPSTVTALIAGLGGEDYPTFADKTSFVQAVTGFVPTLTPADLAKILAIAGQLTIAVDGWGFQISPESWRTADNPTMMLVKYGERTLEDLVADRAGWGFKGAEGDGEKTQARILAIFANARDAFLAGKGDAYARFYRDVVANESWNGFLFLDAPVSISELPADLRFLAAGIDDTRFFAHHLAIGATPYASDGGALNLGQTSISGLIDYVDLTDLVFAQKPPFAFKTLRLTAEFANTALVGFQAQAELMINSLFDAIATKREPEHGNNLVLDGGYQRQNGTPVYNFVLEGRNDYDLGDSALATVGVASVLIQTASAPAHAAEVTVTFLLSGTFSFIESPDFDLFSYGRPLLVTSPPPDDADSALAFANLAVTMAFDLGDPSNKSFAFTANGVTFDPANSAPRNGALTRLFPAKLSGFALGAVGAPAGPTPEDMGYGGINAPLDATPMAAPWYGLVYTVDIGTLGALSGSKPLTLSLLAAWSVATQDGAPPIYLGLKMPDARPLGIDWPLQGVLRLGFRSFDFVASGPRANRAYMLRMRRFALSVLGMSFPPGNLDIFLFGGAPADDDGKLAWYAAYGADQKMKALPPPHAPHLTAAQRARQPDRLTRPQRARRNGRRALPPNQGV